MKKDERLSLYKKRSQLIAYAPDICQDWRKSKGMKQHQLGRLLGVHGTTISAMERGSVRNFQAAEAVLILAGMDLHKLEIEETPGLRERLHRAFELDIPVTHLQPAE